MAEPLRSPAEATREIERLRAQVDQLLPVARMYVDAFGPDETMSLTERMRLQTIEDILADPTGWTPDRPVGYTAQGETSHG